MDKLPEAWSEQQLTSILASLLAHARAIGVLATYNGTDYWIGPGAVFAVPSGWFDLWVVKQTRPAYGMEGWNYYGQPTWTYANGGNGTSRAVRYGMRGANEDWFRQTADDLLQRSTLADGSPESYTHFELAWGALVRVWRNIIADFESRKPVYEITGAAAGSAPQWDQLQTIYAQQINTAVTSTLNGLTSTWQMNMQDAAYQWARQCSDPLLVTIQGLLDGTRIQWTDFNDSRTWIRTDYAIGETERTMLQNWKTALEDYAQIKLLPYDQAMPFVQTYLANCQSWAAQLQVDLPTWESQQQADEQQELTRMQADLEAMITNQELQWQQVIDPGTYYANLTGSVFPYGMDWSSGGWQDGGAAQAQFLILMNQAWAHFRANPWAGINYQMPNPWHMTNEFADTINNLLTPSFNTAQAQIIAPTLGLPDPTTAPTPSIAPTPTAPPTQFAPLPPSGFPTTRPRTKFEKVLNWGAVALIVFMVSWWGPGVVDTGKALKGNNNYNGGYY